MKYELTEVQYNEILHSLKSSHNLLVTDKSITTEEWNIDNSIEMGILEDLTPIEPNDDARDLPKKIRFPKNNKITYSQDFSFPTGIPSDIDFEVCGFVGDSIKLIADGYGRLGGDKYGNGAIYVSEKDIRLNIPEQKTFNEAEIREIAYNYMYKAFSVGYYTDSNTPSTRTDTMMSDIIDIAVRKLYTLTPKAQGEVIAEGIVDPQALMSGYKIGANSHLHVGDRIRLRKGRKVRLIITEVNKDE